MNPVKKKILSLLPRKLIHCDVGARWGLQEPWNSFREFIQLLCFEPDQEEYTSLMRKKASDDRIYPYALSDEPRELCLNLTKSRGCSSLFLPNRNFLNRFPKPERFEIEKTARIEATSMDVLHEKRIIADLDFIKIDVQGAELDILKGGASLLGNTILGAEIEVEFHPLYQGQPLFPDVDSYVKKSLGLQLQDIRKTYWKYPVGINIGSAKGQLIFGDALYFRSPYDILNWCSRFNKNEAAGKIQMACLMGIIYGYLDYSLCILNQPSIEAYLEKHTVERWKSIVVQYGRCLKYSGKFSGLVTNFLNYLYRICQATHEGWAVNGHHLGSRKKFGVFY